MPAQSQTLSEGNKKISDLMDANVSVAWNGVNGTVTGTLKYADWPELPREPKTGHFFVANINNAYLGKPLTYIKGSGSGTTTKSATAEDLVWIMNADEHSQFTLKSGDKTDLTQATKAPPTGKDAIKPFNEKTDFGRFGKSSDYIDGDLSITWDGDAVTGTLEGKLKNYDGSDERNPMNTGTGHFLPLVLSDWYKDKPTAVFVKNEKAPTQETDHICNVGDGQTPITVKYNGEIVAKIDVSGVTLE